MGKIVRLSETQLRKIVFSAVGVPTRRINEMYEDEDDILQVCVRCDQMLSPDEFDENGLCPDCQDEVGSGEDDIEEVPASDGGIARIDIGALSDQELRDFGPAIEALGRQTYTRAAAGVSGAHWSVSVNDGVLVAEPQGGPFDNLYWDEQREKWDVEYPAAGPGPGYFENYAGIVFDTRQIEAVDDEEKDNLEECMLNLEQKPPKKYPDNADWKVSYDGRVLAARSVTGYTLYYDTKAEGVGGVDWSEENPSM